MTDDSSIMAKGARKRTLSLIFYKNFITWAQEINCFRKFLPC